MQAVLIVPLAMVVAVYAQSPPQENQKCTYTLDDKYYDLESLKKDPAMPPYRVFDNAEVYAYNLCGNPAVCSPMAPGDSPACKFSSTVPPQNLKPDDITGIGSLTATAQALGPMDVADLNWKSQQVPPFKPDSTGVKLVFPPFGAAPGGMPGAAGANPYGGPPPPYGAAVGQTPPSPPGYAGWGSPSPPAAASSWGSPPSPPSQYSLPPGWPSPPGPPSNPYGGASSYAGGAGGQAGGFPGASMGKHDHAGLTIVLICDETMEEARPIQFARGQTYKDREGNYMFGLSTKSACPANKPGDILGTGLTWGWFFIICFAVSAFLYFSIGMVYKYKKLGVTGLESIPNIEFWRDLPGLVKDGIAFTVTKVRACIAKGGAPGGGGGGSSGGGYSTV